MLEEPRLARVIIIWGGVSLKAGSSIFFLWSFFSFGIRKGVSDSSVASRGFRWGVDGADRMPFALREGEPNRKKPDNRAIPYNYGG